MWTLLTAILCFYGFLKEFKIGEPFVYFYQNEILNFTRETLVNEVIKFFQTFNSLISLMIDYDFYE